MSDFRATSLVTQIEIEQLRREHFTSVLAMVEQSVRQEWRFTQNFVMAEIQVNPTFPVVHKYGPVAQVSF